MPRSRVYPVVIITFLLLVVSVVTGGLRSADPWRVHAPVVWSSSSNLSEQIVWPIQQVEGAGSIESGYEISRVGEIFHFLRFALRGRDQSDGGPRSTSRVEVSAGIANTQGYEDRWMRYTWKMRVVELPVFELPRSWVILTQWHQTVPTCPPNVALQMGRQPGSEENVLNLVLRGGRLNVDSCTPEFVEFVSIPGSIDSDWHEFETEIGWSSHDRGSIRLKIDGKEAVRADAIPTLYEGMGTYLKQGIYRSETASSMTVDLGKTVVSALAPSPRSPVSQYHKPLRRISTVSRRCWSFRCD